MESCVTPCFFPVSVACSIVAGEMFVGVSSSPGDVSMETFSSLVDAYFHYFSSLSLACQIATLIYLIFKQVRSSHIGSPDVLPQGFRF